MKRRLGIMIEPGSRPTPEELAGAARELDLAIITLSETGAGSGPKVSTESTDSDVE
jgi:hypothetical protein